VTGIGTDQPVITADEGWLRVITLNRPERLNAFSADSYRSLAAALDAAGQDAGVRVALLVGAGRAFSSGVDLDALAAAATSREFADTFDLLIDSLIAFPRPLIAAVHGVAVGFGATILLHCDIVLVADNARLRMRSRSSAPRRRPAAARSYRCRSVRSTPQTCSTRPGGWTGPKR
jgi:enoyl-CoA hydratase/carnithine racemase